MINFEHVTNSGGATRVPGDERHTVAAEAGDALDPRGLHGLREGHRQQDGGESPRQYRLVDPRRAKEEDVISRTPALSSFYICTAHRRDL
jgi:hypothetical protein